MSRPDPIDLIGADKRGLLVEGRDDQIIIEAFLDAGERQRLWDHWRAALVVIEIGGGSKLLDKLPSHPRLWGLIDRDWRTTEALQSLSQRYPRLFVLPRVMIENYAINPQELEVLLPPKRRSDDLLRDIESQRDLWVSNGALWQTLNQRGALEFCRGHEQGYPMALLSKPAIDDAAIEQQYRRWHEHLNLEGVLVDYHQQLAQFQAAPDQHYSQHIHGKNFFNQVVVKALNRRFPKEQRGHSGWLETLFKGNTLLTCPQELQALLSVIVTGPR